MRGGGVRGEWAGDRSRRGTPWHRVWKRDADRVEGGWSRCGASRCLHLRRTPIFVPPPTVQRRSHGRTLAEPLHKLPDSARTLYPPSVPSSSAVQSPPSPDPSRCIYTSARRPLASLVSARPTVTTHVCPLRKPHPTCKTHHHARHTIDHTPRGHPEPSRRGRRCGPVRAVRALPARLHAPSLDGVEENRGGEIAYPGCRRRPRHQNQGRSRWRGQADDGAAG